MRLRGQLFQFLLRILSCINSLLCMKHETFKIREIPSREQIPWPSKSLRPATHSNMNWTPSLWCGRRKVVSMGSTSIESPACPSGGSHRMRGSISGGNGAAWRQIFESPQATACTWSATCQTPSTLIQKHNTQNEAVQLSYCGFRSH